MRRVEILLLCAVAVPAFAQTYDKTDTFEPGKKYTCVPTADHKSWNCNEAGKAVEVKPKEIEPAHEASAPPAESAPPTPPPPPSSRSTLPSYLTNAAASSPTPIAEPPSTVSAAAAHANAPSPPPPPPPARAPQITPPPTKTVPLKPATPKPSAAVVAPPPRPPVKPPLSPRVTHPPVSEAASSGGEFMALPGDHFVVEMGHAASRGELDAARSATHVPNGDLYEVHLRQNGADAWLLLWGSFDTLEAARAARNKLSSAAGTPGWPRRIAPLQAEARRVSP